MSKLPGPTKPPYRRLSNLFIHTTTTTPAYRPKSCKMSSVISPSISSQSMATGQSPPIVKRLSTSSVHSFAEIISASSSAASIHFPEGAVEVVTEEGLRHADIKLEARNYKSLPFAVQLLDILQTLHISSWLNTEVTPQVLRIYKVSGSLTNAVFFVSCPSLPRVRTLLLRIYGPSSGSLISRPRELHTLHVLSSRYSIGPRVYGTFENGRVEEYFDSTTLTASDLRDKTISRWIGARMAELHSVDIEVVEETSLNTRGEGKGWEIGAKKNVRSWLGPAHEVLALPTVSEAIRDGFNLNAFKEEWNRYMQWLSKVDDVNSGSRRVFSHNDAQYGNLLKLTNLKEGTAEHRQIIVVDFEYASPNPASFDIANHFHEWTANYHSSIPHVLNPSRYPTFEERRNFYVAYLEHASLCTDSMSVMQNNDRNLEIQKLDEQVRVWSPASHAMWAIWGIVQAREDLEGNVKEPDFDYIGYARCRMDSFRREIKELGL